MAAERQLRDYARLIRRRWRLLALSVAVGLLLATAGWWVTPTRYTATTVVEVTPLGGELNPGEDVGRTNDGLNLDTEAQIVTSGLVVGAALERMESREAAADPAAVAEAGERVGVTVPPNSTVLEISYTAGRPAAAREGATAVANAYLSTRADRVGGSIDSRLDALAAEQEAQYAEVEEIAADVATSQGAARAEAQARLDAANDEAAALAEAGTPLRAARDGLSPGTVLTPAAAPATADTPVLPLWLAAGGLLGLAGGAGLAAAGERRRSRRPDTVPEAWSAEHAPAGEHPARAR